ncbi:MAG: glycosyltransferase family 2 protein [Rickettsiales bacterium]|nr:glycosyltransferase family 2 protein [Rickettsiales bacterium]
MQSQKILLSVFIITKNEADRIEKIIKALRNISSDILDEILVIDSGSTDKTCEIAANAGAKVIFNQWQGFGAQKIFGENQCRNQWILNIDADEEISPELALEITTLFKKNLLKNFYAFRIRIVNKFRFEERPKKLAYYYNQLRLYHKDFAGFKNSSIHDSVELRENDSQKIGQLKAIIYHQSFRSFEHWIEKINYYSSLQASDSFKKGKNVSLLKIFSIPALAFLKAYILRRYFIYGFDGLIYSYLFAFSRFVKAIKTREIFKANYKN